MLRHGSIRRGSAWLELLLALAAILLLFQLFPSVPSRILAAIDFRAWSRWTWLLLNGVVLALLIAVRVSPSLLESLSKREKRHQSEHTVTVPSPAERIEDVRVLMRRDEAARARLRFKLAFYALAIPVLIVSLGALIGWWRNKQEQVERTSNALLPDVTCDDWHGAEQGVVGIKIKVRPDKDVRVSQVGIFDAEGDGLQLDYRVGIFDPSRSSPTKISLMVEATVPYGHHAPLQDSFRWVSLDKPITLKAGHDYVLAAESLGQVKEDWPAIFNDEALKIAQLEHAWNPLIVGSNAEEVREILLTEKPWPAAPDKVLPKKDGVAHGFANIIASPVE